MVADNFQSSTIMGETVEITGGESLNGKDRLSTISYSENMVLNSNTGMLEKSNSTKDNVISMHRDSLSDNDNISDVLEDADDITVVSNKLTCSSEKSVDVTDVLTQLVVARLWVVLILTFMFTMLMLTAAYLTYSLTLRVEAFHAMYNLFTLFGAILAIKLCRVRQSLQNTFGWARIEVLTSLSTLIFLGGLCFGVAVDSMQASFRISQQNQIQHAGGMLWLGVLGLLLNAFVYVLIGGYSNHQGCQYEKRDNRLWIKETGVSRSLSSRSIQAHKKKKYTICDIHHQSLALVFRDISGLVLVVGCAGVVVWEEGNFLSKYIDPILALLSVGLLLALSYPYARDCCQILLQTMPDHIDVGFFSAQLLDRFPEVLNCHHIHIWSLKPGKVVATAHVVMNTPQVYMKVGASLRKFFHEQGIDQVTIQPEFLDSTRKRLFSGNSTGCLLSCTQKSCKDKQCCLDEGELSHLINADRKFTKSNKRIHQGFDIYGDHFYKRLANNTDRSFITSVHSSSESMIKGRIITGGYEDSFSQPEQMPLRSVSCQFNMDRPSDSNSNFPVGDHEYNKTNDVSRNGIRQETHGEVYSGSSLSVPAAVNHQV